VDIGEQPGLSYSPVNVESSTIVVVVTIVAVSVAVDVVSVTVCVATVFDTITAWAVTLWAQLASD
jgi:hypothetical protein